MSKIISLRTYNLYKNLIRDFMENPPQKGDLFFKEDEDYFIKLEAECLNFETSFIIRDKDGQWKNDENGNLVLKDFNDNGDPCPFKKSELNYVT